MSYYRICPYCGCCLDPGEKCDCNLAKKIKKRRRAMYELYVQRSSRR